MGLHEIHGGLGNPTRRLVNNNKSAAKVALVVDPGEELIVAGNVGDQLERAGFDAVTDPGAIREKMEAAARPAVKERPAAKAKKVAAKKKPADG